MGAINNKFTPVLDHEKYNQLLERDGCIDGIMSYYDDYLEENTAFSAFEQVYAELTWHRFGANTIFMTAEDVDCLLAASRVGVPQKTFPPVPRSKVPGCYCYEFPVNPPLTFGLYFRLHTVRSLLIVNDIEDFTVAWQTDEGFVLANTVTPEELFCNVNMQVNIDLDMMTLENIENVSLKELLKLEKRRMAIMVYYLCHGLGHWRGCMRNVLSSL